MLSIYYIHGYRRDVSSVTNLDAAFSIVLTNMHNPTPLQLHTHIPGTHLLCTNIWVYYNSKCLVYNVFFSTIHGHMQGEATYSRSVIPAGC